MPVEEANIIAMNFPTTKDFLLQFGFEPVETDPEQAFYRYLVLSHDGLSELDMAFNAKNHSIQIIFRLSSGKELAVITSDKVSRINFKRDKFGAGIHVVFELDGLSSEAVVTFEPQLACHWWVGEVLEHDL